MLKKLLPISGIAIATLILLAGSFAGWMSYQMRELKPLDTARISDSVFVVKGNIGDLYLVRKQGAIVAFDAADNPEKIAAGCATLSIVPDSVRAVFLTHSDADHVGGLTAFRNATVYLSRDEEALITRRTPRHLLSMPHFNKLPVSKYQLLGDGDSVVIGDITVNAIATPGHTPGSMCYRVGDGLFSGDLCIIKDGSIRKMLKIFTEDMATDSLSIRKIAQRTDIKAIYTAHTGFTTDLGTALAGWR
jgi:hydroxyacylglutathione hydrolase